MLCGPALAQTSPSYRLDEFALSAGERLDSESYRMSVAAVGQTVTSTGLAGALFSMAVGFPQSNAPPGEVRQVAFDGDGETLTWAPDPSAGTYVVYRGDPRLLPGDAGICLLSALPGPQAIVDEQPDDARAFFYLVTAVSTLLEEGSAGYDSTGAHRATPSPCP